MQTYRKTAAQTIEPNDFLLPEPDRRRRSPSQNVRPIAVEDAVFEVVSPASRSRERVNDNASDHYRTPARPARTFVWLPGLARCAGRLFARVEKLLAGLSPQAFTTLLSALALLVFWMCGGFSALTAMPGGNQSADFEIVRPMIHAQDANGMKVALVGGGIRNTSARVIAAPRLAVVSGTSGEAIGTILLAVDRIGPGVTIPFAGRFKLGGGKSTDLAIIPERP